MKARSISGGLHAELMRKLEQYQSSKKLNRSTPRNRVVEVISLQSDHFTGPDLVARVRKKFPEIGAATVYRCLPLLIEAGILRESLTDNQGQAVYEVQHSDHHDHVVCLDCKAILEFHEVGIESLQAQVLGKLGFQEVQHSHVIYARCVFKGLRG
jgi:Fur family transcriptional regulator, ferric uptake regulator